MPGLRWVRQLLSRWLITSNHLPSTGDSYNVYYPQDFQQVLDISSIVNENNDRGILSLTPHPNFPTQPYFYTVVSCHCSSKWTRRVVHPEA
jgi:hypothetical protein